MLSFNRLSGPILSIALIMITTSSFAQYSSEGNNNVPLSRAKFTVKPALWRLRPSTPPKDSDVGSSDHRPQFVAPKQDDLQSSASGYGHHHGRVHIKVFRGPDDQHNHFAPHGYWVKQPADDGRGFRR